MVSIVLKDNENGYDKVGEYVKRYWDVHGDSDVIVALETSYDVEKFGWTYLNEIASSLSYIRYDIEWLNDWWEGEKYIRIKGIQSVDTIDILGGLYEEDK